jgi:UTP-glucose-1-phosphate uridylyltransferase
MKMSGNESKEMRLIREIRDKNYQIVKDMNKREIVDYFKQKSQSYRSLLEKSKKSVDQQFVTRCSEEPNQYVRSAEAHLERDTQD